MAISGNEPTYYILKCRIPSEHDWLGRVVQYFQDPTASYTPQLSKSSITSSSSILTTTESDFHLKVRAAKDSASQSRLSRLLNAENSASRSDDIEVNAPSITLRRLMNYKSVFEQLKAEPGVTKDMKNMLPLGRTAYMIVGLVEIDCGFIKRSKSTSKDTETGLTLPVVDIALAAASVPITLGGIGDVELGSARKISYHSETSGNSKDREIIALEYRTVRRSLGGWGRQVIYRDSIPKVKGGLSFSTTNDNEPGCGG